ncbi:MAG: aminotransferase class I/II-fold pyridoxal phosphate-dependent enzyme [Candidatus Omnitrophica bacterium]|nr:aminotransferase class I/II-fold pyridoxal phosphate-dependent enzyme [Candidatus Omnitrophota bacterium]
MHEANRMLRLPPYLFTVVDSLKREVRESGKEVIDFSMGNPDFDPPPHVVTEMRRALKIKHIHRYSKPDEEVEVNFRRAIGKWYQGRFGIDFDPDKEILPLIGSKEGVAHLSLAFLNNDDLALVPSPAYPVHFNGVIMAGGILYNIPLKEENGYLPDLQHIPRETTRLSKIMFLSYPHNPTAAVCDIEFFNKVVHWAKDKNMIVAHDLAYSDIVFGDKRAPSILEVKGAKKFCVEFHTLSKSYSMPGWRVGFAVGNKEILASLNKTKSYVDFGLFRAVQMAATAALTGPQGYVKKITKIYKKRVDYFVDALNKMGWAVRKPEATFYVWAKIPEVYHAHSSMDFTELLLRETGVAVSPGTGFGECGEGYVRFALVRSEPEMERALKRIKGFLEMKV